MWWTIPSLITTRCESSPLFVPFFYSRHQWGAVYANTLLSVYVPPAHAATYPLTHPLRLNSRKLAATRGEDMFNATTLGRHAITRANRLATIERWNLPEVRTRPGLIPLAMRELMLLIDPVDHGGAASGVDRYQGHHRGTGRRRVIRSRWPGHQVPPRICIASLYCKFLLMSPLTYSSRSTSRSRSNLMLYKLMLFLIQRSRDVIARSGLSSNTGSGGQLSKGSRGLERIHSNSGFGRLKIWPEQS